MFPKTVTFFFPLKAGLHLLQEPSSIVHPDSRRHIADKSTVLSIHSRAVRCLYLIGRINPIPGLCREIQRAGVQIDTVGQRHDSIISRIQRQLAVCQSNRTFRSLRSNTNSCHLPMQPCLCTPSGDRAHWQTMAAVSSPRMSSVQFSIFNGLLLDWMPVEAASIVMLQFRISTLPVAARYRRMSFIVFRSLLRT